MKQNKSLAAALITVESALFNAMQKKPSSKLANAILDPAYGRLCITEAHVLDWFNRGFDFEIIEPHFHSRYCSIRDFQQGAKIQFRYGKRLQKTFIFTVSTLA